MCFKSRYIKMETITKGTRFFRDSRLKVEVNYKVESAIL